MNASQVVVVGAGLAGLRTAEALRGAGYHGPLELVGAEPHLPYNRPPLSKEALADGVEHAALAFHQRASVSDVSWRLGRAAVSARLDPNQRGVTLVDGEELPARGLVIATGMRPRRLALPGPETGRHVLRTLEDAAALRAALAPGARVVVLGAGFLGCEVAATATLLGAHVQVVAPEELPLLRPLGELLGRRVRAAHEEHGVVFHLGRTAAEVMGPDRVRGVRLDSGQELAADVLVEAVGAECNVHWLASATAQGVPLDLADGVLADGLLRAVGTDGTPVDGVHVVGDLARFPNPLFDEVPRRVEHWSIPTDTGRRAGAALAEWLATGGYASSEATTFAPLPSFWSDQYDLRLQSFGMPGLADRIEVLEGDPDSEVVMGYRRGDDLVGVAGLGMLPRVMALRSEVGRSRP